VEISIFANCEYSPYSMLFTEGSSLCWDFTVVFHTQISGEGWVLTLKLGRVPCPLITH